MKELNESLKDRVEPASRDGAPLLLLEIAGKQTKLLTYSPKFDHLDSSKTCFECTTLRWRFSNPRFAK